MHTRRSGSESERETALRAAKTFTTSIDLITLQINHHHFHTLNGNDVLFLHCPIDPQVLPSLNLPASPDPSVVMAAMNMIDLANQLMDVDVDVEPSSQPTLTTNTAARSEETQTAQRR